MNHTIEVPSLQDCKEIGCFIRAIAEKDLGFSAEAIKAFDASLTSESLEKKITDDRQVLLVAKSTGSIRGVVIGAAPEGGVATIIWLVVDENTRGSGIGASLFIDCCEKYRGIGCHKVKLTAPTLKAAEFYQKQGMVKEGFHANHWWHMDFWSLGMILK